MSEWFVYIAKCRDDSLYCGISTNVERRIHEHNHTKRAARYTRSRRPVSLIFKSISMNRSQASFIEARFKKLKVTQKRELINDIRKFNDYFDIECATLDTSV